MFDANRAKDLQNKSHVRGLLSKEFYYNEQLQLEKKRKQMKKILDQQVQQHRRRKQEERNATNNMIQKQQQKIKTYYANLEARQNLSNNNYNNSNRKIDVKMKTDHQIGSLKLINNHNKKQFVISQPITSFQVHESRVKQYIAKQNNSKLKDGHLPVMSINQQYHKSNTFNEIEQKSNKNQSNQQNTHNIPLLDLKEQNNHLIVMSRPNKYNNQGDNKNKKNRNHKSKRNKPLNQNQENKHIKINQSEFKLDNNHQLVNGNLQKNQNQISDKKIDVLLFQNYNNNNNNLNNHENQNNQLKIQLKRNKQALSLLIGAIKSNNKLDKYRIQAQKILNGKDKKNFITKQSNQKKIMIKTNKLPKIKVFHKCIMHDYMLNAAKQNENRKTKTYQ